MNLFADKTDFAKHILVRSLLDLDLIEPYIEVVMRRKIYPFIPNELIDQFGDDSDEMLLLKKAVAHFAIPIAVPFLKVNLSNAGIRNLQDGKLQNAEWWDVRDMALQSAGIADEALSDLITKLRADNIPLPFLEKFDTLLFSDPAEFYLLTSVGQGYDLFMKLLPIIEQVWLTIIAEQLPDCVLENYNSDEGLQKLLKKAVAFYTLAETTGVGGFAFTNFGLFLMWEQLPWQQSAMLTDRQLSALRETYLNKANKFMALIWKYLKSNAGNYPCLNDYKATEREVIAKKSGLYF